MEYRPIDIEEMLQRAQAGMMRRFEESRHSDGQPVDEQTIALPGDQPEERERTDIQEIRRRRLDELTRQNLAKFKDDVAEFTAMVSVALAETPPQEEGPRNRFNDLALDVANRAIILVELLLYQDGG